MIIRVKFVGSYLKWDKITYTHGKIVHIYIVYETNLWNYRYGDDTTLGKCLFSAVELVKNDDIDK